MARPGADRGFGLAFAVDQEFAERLVDVLRRHQIPVWYSDTDIQGAQQWHDEIGRALQRCDWFIVVLSPESVASMWVKKELMYVLRQDRFEGRIAPLMHRACDYDPLSSATPSGPGRPAHASGSPLLGQWASPVNARWRVTFKFADGDAHVRQDLVHERANPGERFLGRGGQSTE